MLEKQHISRELRTIGSETEFDGLLDRIDGIVRRVREPDDVRIGGLRLQKEDEKSAVLSGA